MKKFNGSKISLMFIGLLGLASVSLAAEGTWATRADMPTARYVLSSSVVDGKIYAIGGDGGSSKVEEYDPVTDTWTRKANMPMTREAGTSSVVNGRIYAIGGTTSYQEPAYSSVIEYDATTDTWTAKADMPTARACVSSSVVNGKIYAFGGASFEAVFSTVEEYDPATDTWTSKADMPTARAYASTSAVNGKIYAIGGNLRNPWYRGLSTVEEYNPATNTWTKKADMPTGRTYFSTSVVNGKIYAIGGLTAGVTDHLSPVEEYNPATDTWTRKADMPTARSGLTTSAVNGKIYAIGGWVGSETILSTVEEYTPPSPVIDFNRDGKVDFKDFSILAQYWRFEGESSVDVAPLFNGDGIVDSKDLRVLAENWLAGTRRASNPHPYDAATNVDLNADLSWTAGADATLHYVYFGTTSPPPFIGNQTAAIFDPCTMAQNTTHYWRIDEVGAYGTTTGTVWRFTTMALEATNPNPANGATGVDINADLSWTAGADATSHDVYFGTTNPPPFIRNQTATTFDPGTMPENTGHYWRIDEVNMWGTTTGTVWRFTTEWDSPPK